VARFRAATGAASGSAEPRQHARYPKLAQFRRHGRRYSLRRYRGSRAAAPAAEQACPGDGGTLSDNAAEASPRRGLKASLNESSGGAVAACTGLRPLPTINSCIINQQTRSAITGRHGPRARAKPENPIQVGLWRPTKALRAGPLRLAVTQHALDHPLAWLAVAGRRSHSVRHDWARRPHGGGSPGPRSSTCDIQRFKNIPG
jgi:hypothetical protein